MYCALVAYIVFEGPEEERNMNTLVEMINSMEVREDDETFKNAVDYMFDGLERRSPQHFAVRQYKKYKLASGKTAKMINEIFLLAFHEIPIMWPIACILEYFAVEKLSRKLAFRMVSPEDKPVFITLAISSMIVCLMCPVMSFIATCLFMHPGNQIIALWLQKTVQNFPMALCWQIFFAGPGVRNVFGFVVGFILDRKSIIDYHL